MKMALFFVVCLALGATAAEPAITDVVVRQRWPWSRLVDITYVLACDSTQKVDVIVNAYDGDTALTLPPNALTGDLYSVSRGQKRIVLDPEKTAYTNEILNQFRVALTPSPVALYMIVDLTASAGATNQIAYVYEAELVTNKWGSWARNPITNNGTAIESVIWTGVTNAVYKTDKLVLRRVTAGSFTMGEAGNSAVVTLTKDFFVGVFPVTQKQFKWVMSNWNPSYFPSDAGPVERVTYYHIRENPSGGDGMGTPISPNWPASNGVGTNSFMGKLRDRTSIAGFDLPTEAQWEYACRAGTTSYFNDGVSTGLSDTNILKNLGWYIDNSGSTTHTVGLKQPNAWGLYDMLGNVYDWCLDWQLATLADAADPKGATSGANRVKRGGCWYSTPDYCRSAFRAANLPQTGQQYNGFRLVRILP